MPIWTNVPSDVAKPSFPVNKDPHGPTFDIVASGKNDWSDSEPNEDVHYLGQLLPSACSRSDERAHAFFKGESVLDR